MPKFGVYLAYKEVRYIEVEATDSDEASSLAMEQADDAQPMGDDDYYVEDVEELED